MAAPHATELVAAAMRYEGVPYVLGAEGDLDEGFQPVRALDCSELVQVALADLGVAAPDGHWNQWRWCRTDGAIIPVAQAIDTPGALLFVYDGTVDGHVAISRGDGTTIEARGRAYGTGVFSARGRWWTHGGLVPGLDYSPPAPPEPEPAPPTPLPPPQEVTPMLHLIVTDDPAYPSNTTPGVHLIFTGDRVAWIRSGAALGILNRSPVPVVHTTVAEVAALLESIPGDGPSPRSAGCSFGW